MRKTILLGAALFSVGCKSGLDEAGIWALYLPADTTIECEDTITHNFSESSIPEDEIVDEGDWTITEELNISDSMTFVQIEELGDGNALLLMGAEAYPGVETANGWKFSWEGSEDSSSTEDHSSGYSYNAVVQGSSIITIKFNVDGETAKGTISSSAETLRSWSETDEWDPKELGFDRGQIPSSAYLVQTAPDGKSEVPTNNRSTNAECGGTCALEVSTVCGGEGTFTAEQLQYDDESVYEYLDAAGQGAGL